MRARHLAHLALFPLAIQPWSWNEQAKLTASDAESGDFLGHCVALDGDTALLGAYLTDDDGWHSGSVYVFVRSGTLWTQQAELKASDAGPQDWFGCSVSLSGNTALVGAYGCDDAGHQSGAAYVFVRSGSVWSQQAKLSASDAAARDRFGMSVAADGDRALIGAPFEDANGTDAGAAYIFLRSGTLWSQEKKITDGVAGDQFGFALSLEGDKALIGAPHNDSDGVSSGCAYMFRKPPSTTNWWRQKKFRAGDASDYDLFGSSVSISGERVLISSHMDDDGGAGSGAAYVFVLSGSVWSQEAKLTAGDPTFGRVFGGAVSLSGDLALIGAWGEQDYLAPHSGSAYVFLRTGSTWTQEAKFKASTPVVRDMFGYAVALDGATALIGKHLDWASGLGSGAAHVVVRTGP